MATLAGNLTKPGKQAKYYSRSRRTDIWVGSAAGGLRVYASC